MVALAPLPVTAPVGVKQMSWMATARATARLDEVDGDCTGDCFDTVVWGDCTGHCEDSQVEGDCTGHCGTTTGDDDDDDDGCDWNAYDCYGDDEDYDHGSGSYADNAELYSVETLPATGAGMSGDAGQEWMILSGLLLALGAAGYQLRKRAA